MRVEANPAKSSVTILMENMNALDSAKNANCRFGIVYELAQIVKFEAASARERIIYFAMRGLESAVTA